MEARYLARGGSTNNLMSLMGWDTPQMVARYVASVQVDLALAEYQRLGLEDD